MKLLILFLFLLNLAWATENHDSLIFPFGEEHGTAYNPSSDSKKDKLIIYIRGLYKGMKDVPPDKAHDSFEDLYKGTYQLKYVIEEMNAPVYLTTSHKTSFTFDQIQILKKEIGLNADAEIILMSHSGGYRGLYQTLKNLNPLKAKTQISQLIMMDNFYMNADWVPEFKKAVENGALCSGFLTSHNLTRYNTRFKDNVKCNVEGPEGFDHFKSVAKCFAGYINNQKCKKN